MGDGSASADLLPEEEVDEDLADDVLDGVVTDAGVEPVMIAGDIGEGAHALGGFAGQLVDLGFDVFGGLFGGHGSFRPRWPRGHGQLELALLVLERRSGSLVFRCCAVSFLRIA